MVSIQESFLEVNYLSWNGFDPSSAISIEPTDSLREMSEKILDDFPEYVKSNFPYAVKHNLIDLYHLRKINSFDYVVSSRLSVYVDSGVEATQINRIQVETTVSRTKKSEKDCWHPIHYYLLFSIDVNQRDLSKNGLRIYCPDDFVSDPWEVVRRKNSCLKLL